MRLVQQPTKLSIENLDNIGSDSDKSICRHGKLLPNSFRAIFCGPSGCGKTNALLSLLFNENGLKFASVYVYSKSLYQPKYQLLQDVLKSVKGISYFQFRDNEDVIDVSSARSNSIFIFDDVACDRQEKIREFFSMGRHKSLDCAFLCQTYSMIRKQLCRDNCNVIVLFRQDGTNLRHVFDEHVTPDLSYEKFKELCSFCWNEPHGFMVIVKDFDLNNGRYRQGFDKYIIM